MTIKKKKKVLIPFVKLTLYDSTSSLSLFTFSDTERVVSAGNKVIKCNKEVWVAFSCPQQVLFGAPAYSLCESCRVQAERPMESFWRKMERDRTGITTLTVTPKYKTENVQEKDKNLARVESTVYASYKKRLHFFVSHICRKGLS